MVEANPPTPPQENPYGYGKEYVYREAKRKGYYHPEIAASFTFTFDRATEETFLGTYYQIVPNSDKKSLEAQSFIVAARGAWRRYRKDETRRAFVRTMLTQTWERLDGEESSGKILDFNPDHDEIVQKPRKATS